MKTWMLAILLLIIAAVSVVVTTNIFIDKNQIIKIDTMKVDFTAGTFAGLTTDTDALHFGTHVQGGGGQRWLNLSNDNTFPVSVDVIFTGDVTPYLYGPQSAVIIGSGEWKTVSVALKVPVGTPLGNYTGEVKLIFKQAG